jgi:hypothetical protein
MIFDGLVLGFQFTAGICFIIIGVFLCRFKDHRLTAAAAALTAAWIFWNLTAQQTRFLYPLLWGGIFTAIHAASLLKNRLKNVFYLLLILSVIPTVILHFPESKHFYLAWKNILQSRRNPAHFTAWQNDELPYAELAGQVKALRGAKIASLWERRTLYLPENVTLIMPCFQEKLTPVPKTPEELYAELKAYDYLIIRPPQKDVDKGIEFVPGALELNNLLLELLKSGRAAIHSRTSDGQISILRIVPETAPISTRSSSESRSSNVLSIDASAR